MLYNIAYCILYALLADGPVFQHPALSLCSPKYSLFPYMVYISSDFELTGELKIVT